MPAEAAKGGSTGAPGYCVAMGNNKWEGIAAEGTRLYAAPYCAEKLLERLEDTFEVGDTVQFQHKVAGWIPVKVVAVELRGTEAAGKQPPKRTSPRGTSPSPRPPGVEGADAARWDQALRPRADRLAGLRGDRAVSRRREHRKSHP